MNNIFGGVDLLQKGLDAVWLRNEVVTNNIANADTPNFKSSSVSFESAFKTALEREESGDGFSAKRTREGHMQFSGETEARDVSAAVTVNDDTSLRMDGNNVDVEAENVELARNTIYYYALSQQVSSEFARLSMAIKEGK